MVILKSQYYAQLNGIDPVECAPTVVNGAFIYPALHADAINAIADDDPGFLEWKNAECIARICKAAKNYVENEIDPAGMVEFYHLCQMGNEYALAVDVWVRSVYQEAETRKSLYVSGNWPENDDITDFSSFGKKPHTVAEVQAWTP